MKKVKNTAPSAAELVKMFDKINQDAVLNGEEYRTLTDQEYYAEQIQNIFEIGIREARRLAKEMRILVLSDRLIITPVIFMMEPAIDDNEDDTVLAVFPNEHEDENQVFQKCYAHIGQHSSAGMPYWTSLSMATPEQYKDLKEELEKNYDYKLFVINEAE
jgi:hypothetical protein